MIRDNRKFGNTWNPPRENRELVSCFIFVNWYGLSPLNIRNQNILIPQNFAQRLEYDGYAGT